MKLLFFIPLIAFSFSKKPNTTPLPIENNKFYFPNSEWGNHALNRVKSSKLLSLNPVDAKEFCPNGMSANNYVHLLTSMAKYESNFKEQSTYKEAFKNSKGEWVISTGLLQLSYESVRGYGFLDATTEKLKDPYYNLTAGIKILETLINKDKRIAGAPNGPYKGAQRYWAVFRGDKLKKTKDTLKQWCE